MYTIEIDFDVFKALTAKRESEQVTYNDVLREILKLGPATKPSDEAPEITKTGRRPWVCKEVSFPHGTEFRSTYKGKEYRGIVNDGFLIVNGASFNSPSAAAISITDNPVNGWIFWECKIPGETKWRKIKTLRKN